MESYWSSNKRQRRKVSDFNPYCTATDGRWTEYREAVNDVKETFGDEVSLPPLRERNIVPISSSATKNKQEGGDQVMEDESKERGITTLIPFLTPEHIAMPKMLSKQEMDSVLLGLRKQALLQEYGA